MLALYLRSVCLAYTAFHGLRCHPLTCILLKLRLGVLSNPIAPTNFNSSNEIRGSGSKSHLENYPCPFAHLLPHSP